MALRCSLGRADSRLPLPSPVAAHVFPVPTPNQVSRESCQEKNSCKVYHLPLTLALSAATDIWPSLSCAAHCLTRHPSKSPVPTAECNHITVSKKPWTSGSPTEPLSHGLLAPLSLIPTTSVPLRGRTLGRAASSVPWRGTAAVERQREDRSTGHPETRQRTGPGGSPPSQRREVSGMNKSQCGPGDSLVTWVCRGICRPPMPPCPLSSQWLTCWPLVCGICCCQWVRRRGFGLDSVRGVQAPCGPSPPSLSRVPVGLAAGGLQRSLGVAPPGPMGLVFVSGKNLMLEGAFLDETSGNTKRFALRTI